jgi:hypothetical protein
MGDTTNGVTPGKNSSHDNPSVNTKELMSGERLRRRGITAC